MKAINFPEANINIASDQPEFNTLPAHCNENEGTMTYCFELSKTDIETILKTRRIYFKQLTYGEEMQPICPSVNKSDLI